MNVIKEIDRINKLELDSGIVGTSASWHEQYKSSAWVYIGNLPTQLTEGDVLAVMSQWGEIEDINLVREEETGKSKGFCFLKYEDFRSCILAVDNFIGLKILGRSLRVDHVENYRLPKHVQEKIKNDGNVIEENGLLKAGHAYEGSELANDFDISKGQDLFAQPDGEAKVDSEKEAKRKRKEERDRIRREREIHRQEREEKRRLSHKHKEKKKDKRKKQYSSDHDESSHSEKRRRKRRYDSESELSDSDGRQKDRKRHDSDDK